MDADGLLQQLLDNPTIPSTLSQPLADSVAAQLVEHLKQEADRYWWIDANQSLKLANLIVLIGEKRSDLRQQALGLMARGDAQKFLGHLEEAWDTLDQAGTFFRLAEDDVGWGRTRIGRLLLSADLNRVDEAMADANRARAIFNQHHAREMMLRLDLNTGIVFDLLGDYQNALEYYASALGIAQDLDDTGRSYLGALYTNMGYAYSFLGDLRRALNYYEKALPILNEHEQISAAAVTNLNIAYVAQAQGHYRHALALLHQVSEQVGGQFLLESSARRDMVECYLHLNRYAEARDLARLVIEEYQSIGADYERARTLLHLATAEAELANLKAAQAALDTAEPIFRALEAQTWLATVHLWRGRIDLKRSDIEAAREAAQRAAAALETAGERANYGAAVLLEAETLFASGDWEEARRAGTTVLRIARQCNLPSLRYSAHLLMGIINEAQQNEARALRHYRAAAHTVERVQSRLTITLRPGFLKDKEEALRSLIRLHLKNGHIASALETLERAKSQVLLNFIANREALRWATNDPQSQALIEELDALREEHHWYYRLAHEQLASDQNRQHGVDPRDAMQELAEREKRMRTITERLYLAGHAEGDPNLVFNPSLQSIQQNLPGNTTLVEYYIDDETLWAFTLDGESVEVHALPATWQEVNDLLAKFQFNIACALRVGVYSPVARNLTSICQRILAQLYRMLLAPLAARLMGRARLVIVPYSALHYLPFHLLVTSNQRYLIEENEVVILPAAGLITQPGPKRMPGAKVLAYSKHNQLPATRAEAQMVHAVFSGDVSIDGQARRTSLEDPPRQILHIAAHGEHRIQQPDLSYIELADGQLFTDDLLQHDMSYELVTLSACDTGRAHVVASDELIGLGRGFLYAGAGALITSLWRIQDSLTVTMMEHFYRCLHDGASKAAALREAQLAILSAERQLHPAYWGAFQLVGDACPLSTTI